ncbi:DUF6883 domain-containing protein [Carboxydichorda subterranea]|uniref:DUF6883 domain-containing protein n=1 Tax=Carboxydichorda subterranea TaxID=3109565 RepID=UPI003857DB88
MKARRSPRETSVFRAPGFTRETERKLTAAILEIARRGQLVTAVDSPYGTKYIVDGILTGPTGRVASVITVWVVEPDDPRPRFVTAYPK